MHCMPDDEPWEVYVVRGGSAVDDKPMPDAAIACCAGSRPPRR
jgi:hypothetical protein